MQIKNFLLIVGLAAANASPLSKRGSGVATYDQCMTITFDPNQGVAFYKVPVAKQDEVKSDCKACIMKTAGCTPSGSDGCRALFDICAKELGIALS